MAEKFIEWDAVNGRYRQNEALVVSAGAGDAGKIIGLDSTGKLDVSLLPTGVGPAVYVLPASENLSAGAFVNVWDDSGTVKVRLADASNNRRAHGYVKAGVTAPANATVYYGDVNAQLSSLTKATSYFLSNATPGGVEDDVTGYAAGELIQFLGTAISDTELVIDLQEVPIELA